MSIDYDPVYGIGFEVMESEEIAEIEEMEDGLLEYLDCGIDSEVFECFQPGNGFTGEQGPVYLVLRDAFKDGLDLTNSKAILEAEAARLKVDIIGDFGLVGGLRVW